LVKVLVKDSQVHFHAIIGAARLDDTDRMQGRLGLSFKRRLHERQLSATKSHRDTEVRNTKVIVVVVCKIQRPSCRTAINQNFHPL
jgi:hypothetical protein